MPASFLFDMAAKASLVMLIAWAATRVMSRQSAAMRHAVWVTAFGALVVLPALMMAGPAWRVSVMSGTWAARADAVLSLSTRASRTLASADVWPATAVASHAPIDASGSVSGGSANRTAVASSTSFAWTRRPTWLAVLVGLWAAGVVLMLLRVVIGLAWANWLVRSARPTTGADWLAVRDGAAERVGAPRAVRLKASDRIGVPVACGIVTSTILLPPQAESWDEPRRRIVLLHELAHVKRRDCLTQVLAQTARALHWFNPLVLVAVARLYREQERACDDVVLKAGAAASDYADHLCEIVRTARTASAPPWAILALARQSRLHDRVVAILDERVSRQSPSRAFCAALTGIVCAALVPVSAIQPAESNPGLLLSLPSSVSNTEARSAFNPVVDGGRPLVVMSDADARGFVTAYCVSCHSDQQKTAGISLATYDVSTSTGRPEIGEKIVRRLRAGVHPPPGRAQPRREEREAFSASIEDAIDRAARVRVGADAITLLADRELADRLAKFLWNDGPDRELLQAAEQGTLRDAEGLRRQIQRMLADGRADRMFADFFGRWLQLDRLKTMTRDVPEFDAELRDAVRRELELFVASQVREDRPLIDLLTANYSFVNDRLARHYRIANVAGHRFQRVSLTDEARFGLLGKAGILALTAVSNRTSPVIRGKYVLETVLGVSPPAPPPNVPALKPLGPDDPPMSMRERLEAHHRNPVCASCHLQLDDIGFALENFDNVGGWRAIDGTPIDASGRLADGTTFDGPAGLRRMLVDRKDLFVSTLTLRLLGYSLGRPAQYGDMPTVRAIVRDTASTDNRWSSVIAAMVQSRLFQAK